MTGGSDRLHLGVDVGTQGARAVLVTSEGSVVARAAHALDLSDPGPVQQQSPVQWWEALVASVAALGEHRRAVGSIAISCTSGSVCAVDEAGASVGPGLLYADRRAVAIAGMDASWAMAKIGWLVTEGAALVRGASGFTSPGGFLTGRLLGRPAAIDVTQALKFGVDPQTQQWGEVPVDPAMLPEVVATGTALGMVSGATAELIGLPIDTVVVAGATDGIAGQIACRPSPQRAAIAIGSTIVWKAMSAMRIDAGDRGIYSHRGPEQWWLPGAASNAGARILATWADAADLDRFAATVELTPAIEPVYPAVGAGERFPFVDPGFLPWTVPADATPAQRYGAEVLGIALVERWGLEELVASGCDAPSSIATTGGVASSATLTQLRADVLQLPVEVPSEASSAFGAAVIAAAPTHGGVLAAADAMVRFATTIDPTPASAGRWDETHRRFRARCGGSQEGTR